MDRYMEVSECKDMLVMKVEGQAEWRDNKQDEHPEDLRNGNSAKSLRALAVNLQRVPSDDPRFSKLVRLYVAGIDIDPNLAVNAEGAVLEHYGFAAAPDLMSDTGEVLDDLVSRLEEGLEEASDSD